MAESSKGLWFLLGLGVGMAAGVLYAPQPGEQTREMLRSKAEQGREMARRKASDLRAQASEWREQAGNWREQAGSIREQAVSFADRGKQAVTRQIDQFQAAVEAGKQAYRESAGLNKTAEGGDEDAASRL